MSRQFHYSWIIPYSDYLYASAAGVWCKICDTEFKCNRKSHVNQHISGNAHKRKLQETNCIPPTSQTDTGSDTFYMELCEAFVAANIPFHKLNNPVLKKFLEKYCNKTIPDESTIRKNYLTPVYNKTVETIKKEISQQYIWLSVDETTDTTGRSVANIVIGTLHPTLPSTPFLISCEILQKTDAETVANLVMDTLNVLFPNKEHQQEKVLLFVTDAAAYMKKAGKILQECLPRMIHLTCLAHALHRISEFAREHFSDVDQLISEAKKIFLKAPKRRQLFKEKCPDLQLPPQPVVTRWGTWIKAASYYADNFNKIKEVILDLDDTAQSVTKCKKLVTSSTIFKDLTYLNKHFGDIPNVINLLETQHLFLVTGISKFEEIVYSLDNIEDEFGEKLKHYMQTLIQRNSGFSKLKTIANILQSSDSNVEFYQCFNFAPVTSCEVERTFSRFKDVLSPKRTRFTPENLKKYVVVYCNKLKDPEH